ncbi:hypothetical protein RJ641_002105 [Dillenia turbinata]|uniref:DUF7032 domain-containing protein n=1 Tax=Dillenia turbinata TaxID=194707 RepID=A0AAN8VMA7_9MAGN
MGEEEQSQEPSPASLTGKPALRELISLISSLITLSHSIKVFHSKWQLIRNKLDELNSSLVALENCSSDQNTVISEIVLEIFKTVNESQDLAARCVNVSFSGKLLMQSDLDLICTKFDFHVKKLSGVYSSGILTNGSALVVSKPGFGATKDDMRFYVRDLFSRLKIGDVGMKLHALIGLNEVVTDDEKYVKIVVLEFEDLVGLLVNFLDNSELGIQEMAVKVCCVIAGFDCYKGILIGNGVVSPLIRFLESGSDMGKELAAVCLMKLTENSDNAWSVSAHGGATALLKLCGNGDCRAELVGPVCGVLRNLAGVEEIKRFMVEEGMVPVFVNLAKSKDEVLVINAIEFLQAMAYGDEVIRQMIIREGGIRVLVRILDPRALFSSKGREIALRAIENFCFSSANSLNLLMSYRFMDHLLFFLRNGEVSVQELALKLVFRLCGTSEEANKAMGDAGFMLELVKFLNAKSFEIREMAAEALSCMVLLPRNRKKFVQEDGNIGLLLQSLDLREGNSGNRKFLLSTLISLTSCNSARRKIVNSGYLKNIEKLAQAEVHDAKKLVRKLSSNRFRSMLSGIWHS